MTALASVQPNLKRFCEKNFSTQAIMVIMSNQMHEWPISSTCKQFLAW